MDRQSLRDGIGAAIVGLERALDELNAPESESPSHGRPQTPNLTPKSEPNPHRLESGVGMPVSTGQRIIPWGAQVSPEFLESVLWIENQLGLKVECLMACMKFESNLDPAAKNPLSSGSGLIQFMESTARRLGTTTALLRAMPAVTQLSYVFKYFSEYKKRGFKLHTWTIEDTYMAILWPAAIGKSPEYRVFIDDPNRLRDAYDVNKGLDKDGDGFITKAEACARVIKLYNEGTTPANAGFL